MLIVCAFRAISRATVATGGSACAAPAVTPTDGGVQLVSSSSSSFDDQQEFRELIRKANVSRYLYSDATHKVGRLQLCLNVVDIALSASERETAALRVAAADA